MQHGLVFLGHRSRGGFRLALFVEEAAIEGLLRAGRFRFEPVQYFFVEQCPGAFRHRAFFDDVVDPVQDRVGGQFALRQAKERLHFLGEPVQGCRQVGGLLV